jgi:hypothetical protein
MSCSLRLLRRFFLRPRRLSAVSPVNNYFNAGSAEITQRGAEKKNLVTALLPCDFASKKESRPDCPDALLDQSTNRLLE